MLAEGDRDGAARLVREAWRSEELSERTEAEALEAFRDLLTREDHRARMDKRIGAKDLAGRKARRATARQRGDCDRQGLCRGHAPRRRSTCSTRSRAMRAADLGYMLCRLKWLMRHDRIDDAARLMLEARRRPWRCRTPTNGGASGALSPESCSTSSKFSPPMRSCAAAAVPASDHYRAEIHFMCGWIALRYLDDPATARAHFAHIDEGSANPIVLARAHYWRGRAAEALGEQRRDARRATRPRRAIPTAYYGQLARAQASASTGSSCARPRQNLLR